VTGAVHVSAFSVTTFPCLAFHLIFEVFYFYSEMFLI